MYRVVIAEDEMLVRLGLKHALPWDKYEMTVIADVSNGQEAWDVCRTEKPDVLITDIKMPVMDGMMLIANVRAHNPDMQIIILTCLEDFEVARRALTFNVREYILKLEMTPADMERILSSVQEKLHRKQRPEIFHTDVDAQTLKDNLIQDFLFGSRYSEAEFASKAAALQLRLSPNRMVAAMMEIDQFDRLRTRFQDNKGTLIRMSLLNVLNEVLGHYRNSEPFSDSESRFLILFSFEHVSSEQQVAALLHKTTEHIRSVLNMYFNVTVTFAVGGVRQGYHTLKEQYRECVQTLERKFFIGVGHSIQTADRLSVTLSESAKQRLLRLPLEWEVNEYDRKELDKKIRVFVAQASKAGVSDIKNTFVHWLFLPALSMRLDNINMPHVVSAYIERINQASTFDEAVVVFQTYLHEIAGYLSGKKTMGKEIFEVVRYIDGNYANELSLPFVSIP